ncbi:MAG: SAM-dependent methyltransferase [Flavobacteriales bacterium]|nr:SAM-dependent methyltransferase [Flavobacteriales bacterium]
MGDLKLFLNKVSNSFVEKRLVKITLSKPVLKSAQLLNVYIRPVEVKGEIMLSFTYHNKTNDQVKNYSINQALEQLESMMEKLFKNAVIFTLDEDFTVQFSKKGKSICRTSAPSFSTTISSQHNKQKTSKVSHGKYLNTIGITNENGMVIPKMADKYKQINKYIEIVESLIKDISLKKKLYVVDMGSGKGYLTFALYDYLVNQLNIEARITGVETRQELVDFCNQTAKECEFENLKFEHASIQEFNPQHIDILIALHACDTATDDALFKGIQHKAQLIITAPCCHKQIRQQLKGKDPVNPIMKYGIFKERQYEMVTDTLRALILEKNQYDSHIFEFVSNEHTRKNVMLIGKKTNKKHDLEAIEQKIKALKNSFGISQHYLETLI